jgi:hypothetical protein
LNTDRQKIRDVKIIAQSNNSARIGKARKKKVKYEFS